MPADSANLPLEPPGRAVFSVSALNLEARQALESGLGTVWVEGEISNFARPPSGHMYWSLKDEHAQVRCAFFRQYARGLKFQPANGMQVQVRARVSIYEPRGDYQLIVDYMEEAGEGALRRRFEQLKARLEAEGLFAAARKQALPVIPRRIGVITSPTGAAVRDILTALARRFPAIPVLIYPSLVQGSEAAGQLAAAIALANRRADCDVLILARGGGSLEDLWAFNEEPLARAIAQSAIPIISGVGHETDFTIADWVADLRAPTPSQAAELAVPRQSEWLQGFERTQAALERAMAQALSARHLALERLGHRIDRHHPGRRVEEYSQRLDEATARLRHVMQQSLAGRTARLQESRLRLGRVNPAQRTALLQAECRNTLHRLQAAIRGQLTATQHRLAMAGASLNSLSPLATLERGYAIATRDDEVITSAAAIAPGTAIAVRLASGSLAATVTASHPQSAHQQDDSPA